MTNLARPRTLAIGGRDLAIPTYFASVSSLKTALTPRQCVDLLSALSFPSFLISAFDLYHATPDDRLAICDGVRRASDSGSTVLLDSGNYESYWKGRQADWQQETFHQVLGATPCNLAFGYDYHDLSDDPNIDVIWTIEQLARDRAAAGSVPVAPIVHGRPHDLVKMAVAVCESTDADLIAVAERELGDGLPERAARLKELRSALDATGRYIGVHLLGTGNPLSLAILTAAGADFFDGLEWCQTAVDHSTGHLSHITHSEFLEQRGRFTDADDLTYFARTLASNLAFFETWIGDLRIAIENDEIERFLRERIPSKMLRVCAERLEWRG